MKEYDIQVTILRRPTSIDWERCKDLAMRTMGKKWSSGEVTPEWMHRMLECRHSPIRTLMFTIELVIPYYVSVHLVRHKFGIEHFVESQRNDRQSNYDRELAPQCERLYHCPEYKPCGYWQKRCEEDFIEIAKSMGVELFRDLDTGLLGEVCEACDGQMMLHCFDESTPWPPDGNQ